MEPDRAPTPSADWLKWLGERRDGFLVGGAVLYGLGYLVWSYNAWRNHLGQLPAVEFQYLMSGLIPAFIIAIAWAAATFFSNMQDKTIALFERYPSLLWASLAISVVQLTFSLGVVAAVGGWINLGWTTKQLVSYTLPVFLVMMYLAILTRFTSRSRKLDSSRFARFTDKLNRVYQYGIPVAFCWYSLVIYFDLYPRLPLELGGPEPRCAYLDLVGDAISPSSLSVLVPTRLVDAAAGSESKVVRSNRLRVYFSSDDYLLVRTGTDGKAESSADLKDVPLYELRKEVIRAVEWCAD